MDPQLVEAAIYQSQNGATSESPGRVHAVVIQPVAPASEELVFSRSYGRLVWAANSESSYTQYLVAPF